MFLKKMSEFEVQILYFSLHCICLRLQFHTSYCNRPVKVTCPNVVIVLKVEVVLLWVEEILLRLKINKLSD